jgi:2-polyprenyl-6-methoxyphenol hydroxylase-like FAD-dependent oxidoreductase
LFRKDLRRILLNSLDDGTVQWGCKLKTITQLTGDLSGQHKLIFENSREETADFVVGADGAWSVIRPLLSPAKPIYSGISFIDLTISAVDSRSPPVAALVGQGLVFIVSDDKGLIAQRNSGGLVRVYVALRVAEGWLDEFEGKILPHGDVDAKHAQDAIIGLFPGWAPELLDLLRFCDPEPIVPRKIYMLPIPHTWTTRRGLTLLGDAAHLMSPFAGEGVNLAMIDATELGLALVDFCKSAGDGKMQDAELLEETIRKYEKKMCERGAEMAKESAENLDLIFCANAPKPLLDRMAFYHSRGKGGEH